MGVTVNPISGGGSSSGGLQGTWNASTNTPTLANTDTGKLSYMYQVSTGGTVDFGAGSITFEAKDIVVNNGTVWDKIDSTDAVVSVNGNTGVVTLVKSDVGLSNVDNTSDANKPVSTAQLAALNLKANSANPTFTGTVSGVTKTHIGLPNVPNTDATNASNIGTGILPDARLSANIRRSLVDSFPVDDNIIPSCVVGLARVAKTYTLPGASTLAPSCTAKLVGLGALPGQFTADAEVTATDTVTVYYSYNDNSAGTVDIGEKTVYIENTKA